MIILKKSRTSDGSELDYIGVQVHGGNTAVSFVFNTHVKEEID
jgi:hypothetical protein